MIKKIWISSLSFSLLILGLSLASPHAMLFTGASAILISDICGNSQIESLEQCDDGNLTNGDGCSSSCQTEGFSCTNPLMYAIHDEGTDDSVFFKYNSATAQITAVNTVNDADIEAMDHNPTNGHLYAFTGDYASQEKYLVVINPTTGIPADFEDGILLDIGGGQEYKASSFNPITGDLWASGRNINLRTIDLNSGESTVQKTITGGEVEAIAWTNAGDFLYIAQADLIKRYNPANGQIDTMCNNADTVGIVGMEFDQLDNLVVGTFEPATGQNVDIFDLDTCSKTNSDLFDDVVDPYDDVETMSFTCLP